MASLADAPSVPLVTVSLRDSGQDGLTEALRPVIDALPAEEAAKVRDYVFEPERAARCLREVSKFVLGASGIAAAKPLEWRGGRSHEETFADWLSTLRADGPATIQVVRTNFGDAARLFVVLPSSLDVRAALEAAGVAADLDGIVSVAQPETPGWRP